MGYVHKSNVAGDFDIVVILEHRESMHFSQSLILTYLFNQAGLSDVERQTLQQKLQTEIQIRFLNTTSKYETSILVNFLLFYIKFQ